MDHRLTLSHVDFEQQTIHLNGHNYPLDNTCFQTVDPTHPEILTSDEAAIVTSLLNTFTHCQKLRKHLRFLIDNGNMYQLYNQNLLFHGCIPVDEAGNFLTLTLANRQYAGKSLLDFFDHQIRTSFDHPLNQDNLSTATSAQTPFYTKKRRTHITNSAIRKTSLRNSCWSLA